MLLVVFVPMLLDPEPRPARTGPTLAIPPKDNPPPLPAPSAAPISSSVAPATSVTPAKAGGQAEVAVAPAKAEAQPSETGPRTIAATAASGATKQEVASAATKQEVASGATKPAAPQLEGFAVQVGAFRDESKLGQARDKIAAAGVVHYTERIESKGGAMTRLRAGPFPTRDAAEAALAKLKRASLDGKVVPLAAEREERKP